MVLSSPSYANIATFLSKAASILHLAPDDDVDDMHQPIAKVLKQIRSEVAKLSRNKKQYKTLTNTTEALEETSITLMELLGTVSPKLDRIPSQVHYLVH